MTQNLLVQRFKSAKKELTALKTIHPRGVGLVNIYKETVTFTASGQSFLNATVTVTFSQNFAAYPFVYVLGYTANVSGRYYISMDTESLDFSNNGFTATFAADAIYAPSLVPNKFDVYASSPMTSITYTWS